MTTVDHVSASLHLALALFLLVVFVFYFWRQYRIDALRERLFVIRGELFDYARSGAVSFDNPAYTRLRVVMNRMIRFAHKFTFGRIVMIVLFRRTLNEAKPESTLAQWEEAVSQLPAKKQKEIRDLHDEMMSAIVWHITTGSPILLLIFTFFAIRSLLTHGHKTPWPKVTDVSRSLPGVNAVEVQAIGAEIIEEEDCKELEPVSAA